MVNILWTIFVGELKIVLENFSHALISCPRSRDNKQPAQYLLTRRSSLGWALGSRIRSAYVLWYVGIVSSSTHYARTWPGFVSIDFLGPLCGVLLCFCPDGPFVCGVPTYIYLKMQPRRTNSCHNDNRKVLNQEGNIDFYLFIILWRRESRTE